MFIGEAMLHSLFVQGDTGQSIPRTRDELRIDLLAKIQSLLKADPSELVVHDDANGILSFAPDGKWKTLSIALTSFASVEDMSPNVLPHLKPCGVLAASHVFEHWILEVVDKHSNSDDEPMRHFDKDAVLHSVFKDDVLPATVVPHSDVGAAAHTGDAAAVATVEVAQQQSNDPGIPENPVTSHSVDQVYEHLFSPNYLLVHYEYTPFV